MYKYVIYVLCRYMQAYPPDDCPRQTDGKQRTGRERRKPRRNPPRLVGGHAQCSDRDEYEHERCPRGGEQNACEAEVDARRGVGDEARGDERVLEHEKEQEEDGAVACARSRPLRMPI